MVPAAHHLGTDVLCQLIGREGDQVRLHDVTDFRGEEQITGSVHRAMTGEDDRAMVLFCKREDFLIDAFSPDNDEESGPLPDHGLLGLGIIADDHDPAADIVVFDTALFGHGQHADPAVDLHFRIIKKDLSVDRPGDVLGRYFA